VTGCTASPQSGEAIPSALNEDSDTNNTRQTPIAPVGHPYPSDRGQAEKSEEAWNVPHGDRKFLPKVSPTKVNSLYLTRKEASSCKA